MGGAQIQYEKREKNMTVQSCYGAPSLRDVSVDPGLVGYDAVSLGKRLMMSRKNVMFSFSGMTWSEVYSTGVIRNFRI